MLPIYIPSLDRHRLLCSPMGTLGNIPRQYHKNVRVVVHTKQQAALYRTVCPEAVQILVNNVVGLTASKRKIGLLAAKAGEPRFAIFDDDLRFQYRADPNDWHLTKLETPAQFKAMMTMLEECLTKHGCATAGISAREGNNRIPGDYLDNTRLMRAVAFVTEEFNQLTLDTRCMQDFDATLQLLRKGLPNRAIYRYTQDQQETSAPGGCATYRTPAVHAQAAEHLKSKHPDFVTLVRKVSKSGGALAERVDVRIAWKKAYAEGLMNREGI